MRSLALLWLLGLRAAACYSRVVGTQTTEVRPRESALGVSAGGLLQLYESALVRHPWPTKIISSGIIGGMGDVLIQYGASQSALTAHCAHVYV